MDHLKQQVKNLLERAKKNHQGSAKAQSDRIHFELENWYEKQIQHYTAKDLLKVLTEIEQDILRRKK